MVQVEGLRSYKAIAFISNKAYMRLDAKTYSVLRISLQRKTQIFPEKVGFCVETPFDVTLMDKIGDEKWKK